MSKYASVECEVCGEPGLIYAKERFMWVMWSHRDPRVCRDNLQRKHREIQRQAEAIKAAVA